MISSVCESMVVDVVPFLIWFDQGFGAFALVVRLVSEKRYVVLGVDQEVAREHGWELCGHIK